MKAKYGARHQRERLRWANALRRIGRLTCVRCALPIIADTATDGPLPHLPECKGGPCTGECWHLMELDHDDTDPTGRTYLGPAHMACNRAAGGRKAHMRAPRRAPAPGTTRYGGPLGHGTPMGPTPGTLPPTPTGPTLVREW